MGQRPNVLATRAPGLRNLHVLSTRHRALHLFLQGRGSLLFPISRRFWIEPSRNFLDSRQGSGRRRFNIKRIDPMLSGQGIEGLPASAHKAPLVTGTSAQALTVCVHQFTSEIARAKLMKGTLHTFRSSITWPRTHMPDNKPSRSCLRRGSLSQLLPLLKPDAKPAFARCPQHETRK